MKFSRYIIDIPMKFDIIGLVRLSFVKLSLTLAYFAHSYRFNGHHIMKPSWPHLVRIVVFMYGTCLKLERNNQQKMRKMDLQNYFLSMADTLLRFQIFRGIPMTHGLFVRFQKTILCR